MALRDRLLTAATARSILSWRIAVGVGVAVVLGLVGLPPLVAAVVGVGLYVVLVVLAVPDAPAGPRIDPFALGEPWRQFVQRALRAGAGLEDAVAGVRPGPLRDRLDGVVGRFEHGLSEAWRIAACGDEIDDAVRRLDPTALRSRLDSLRQRAATSPSPDVEAAIASVEGQLASADRLRARSTDAADRLRLLVTRLDELVARASEVAVGAADTDAYASEVDELVVELEALRLAVEETGRP